MSQTAISVEVDDMDLADKTVDNLGWDMETVAWHGFSIADITVVCDEAISPARMRGIFWTTYADIAEAGNTDETSS